MPPRKRAQSAPKTEQPDETVETEAAAGSETPAEDATPDELAAHGAPQAEDPPEQPDEPDAEPERSNIQTGDNLCPVCLPGGWAAQADIVGAVGCEHGTWQREVH